jgi:hypothetical protein
LVGVVAAGGDIARGSFTKEEKRVLEAEDPLQYFWSDADADVFVAAAAEGADGAVGCGRGCRHLGARSLEVTDRDLQLRVGVATGHLGQTPDELHECGDAVLAGRGNAQRGSGAIGVGAPSDPIDRCDGVEFVDVAGEERAGHASKQADTDVHSAGLDRSRRWCDDLEVGAVPGEVDGPVGQQPGDRGRRDE